MTDRSIQPAFGNWLKEVRKKERISQSELAKAAKNICTSAYISWLERGGDPKQSGEPPRPRLEVVDALTKALNRPLDEGRKAAGYGTTDKHEAPEETSLLSLFRNLPNQQQSDLLLLAEALHGRYGSNQELKTGEELENEQPDHPLRIIPSPSA